MSSPADTGSLSYETQGWEDFWEEHFKEEPYYDPALDFEDYAAAYQLGSEYRRRQEGEQFDDIAGAIHPHWERLKRSSRLTWDQAREAVRAAWERNGPAVPLSSDSV